MGRAFFLPKLSLRPCLAIAIIVCLLLLFGLLIPSWANLADSPWPMRGHDPQHTGRSPYIGSPTNRLKWFYTTGLLIGSSPAIGPDGTIYVGSGDRNLYAINPDGTLKWKYATGDQISWHSPAISSDGSVYVGSYEGKLYAINTNGTLKWSYPAGCGGGWVQGTSPAIGPV